MTDKVDKEGLDIVGFGKIAKAIPPEVYKKSTKVLVDTFESLVAPITQTTAGLGRYMRQKFDNMVEVEKAIATYTIQEAVQRASKRAASSGKYITSPSHPKSFIKSIEEASKETDPLLHEMWTNLLASQLLLDDKSHPHFVEILPHFSPDEAKLLVSLLPRSEVGENKGEYVYFTHDSFKQWIRKSGERSQPWTISCVLLCEFHFADVLGAKEEEGNSTTILYRTATGLAFLKAVSVPT